MRRTAAGLALAALAAGGCAESGRDRVEDYIAAANAVQKRTAPRFADANKAYAEFASGKLVGEGAVPRLEAAERAIIATRSDLAALRPPAEARELHRRLLVSFDANADLAAETTVLARYLPAAAAAVKPIGGMNARLRRRLREARRPESQGLALERYASGVDGVLARLRRLRPAPVVRATHDAQLRRLRDVSRLARRLRAAVEARDSRRTARLLVRFRRLERGSREGGRLSRESIQAYNRRYRGVLDAAARVQRERARLDRLLE